MSDSTIANRQYREYTNQVPSKRPKDSIRDEYGRFWKQAIKMPELLTNWDYENNEKIYFAWFSRSNPPDEGEIVQIGAEEYTIVEIYNPPRTARAVVWMA